MFFCFSRLLSEFNDHVQLNYLYIPELTSSPLMHIVDTGIAFYNPSIVPSRNIDVASRTIEFIWIEKRGPPKEVSADLEFFNTTFCASLPYFSMQFNARPARRHK